MRGVRESFEYLGHHPIGTIFVWLVIGIVLALPAGFHLINLNLSQVAGEWQGRPGLVVYMQPGAASSVIEEAASQLRDQPAVDYVKTTSSEEAFVLFRDAVGITSSVEELGENPLPAAIEVRMVLASTPSHLADAETRALGMEGVEEVLVEHLWIKRLSAIQEVASRLAYALAVTLGLAILLVVGNTVRSAIEARLDEVEVLHQLGAPDRFVKRPFNYCGILYGLGGGAASMLLIAFLLGWIRGPLQRLSLSYGTEINLVGFDWALIGTLVLGGGILGWAGAAFETRKRLKKVQVAE